MNALLQNGSIFQYRLHKIETKHTPALDFAEENVAGWQAMMAMAQQSQAEHVREFTAGAGQPTPYTPELMTAEEVHFITKMIIDETLELWATLFTSDEAVAALVDIVKTAKKLPKEVFSDDEQGHIDQVAAQADALVDIQYYMLNCAAKKGINMSAIFGVVQ